jgi:dCTP diphosphatase
MEDDPNESPSTEYNSANADSLLRDLTTDFVRDQIPAIVQRSRRFAEERDWLQYHTPRNLALALMGEIGELAELFQFLGDDDTNAFSTVEQLDKIGQEIADITIYMCRLSDICDVSLPEAIRSIQRDQKPM